MRTPAHGLAHSMAPVFMDNVNKSDTPSRSCRHRPLNYSAPATPEWKPAEADGEEDEPAMFASESGAGAVPQCPASTLIGCLSSMRAKEQQKTCACCCHRAAFGTLHRNGKCIPISPEYVL